MLNSLKHSDLSQEMQQCIQNCLDCHNICLATIPHCLKMGGDHASPDHIVTLLDCAEICATSADFMLVNSAMHSQTCGVCAVACERCAEDCEQLANGDQQMLACAEICRRCAETCKAMSKHHG